MQIAVDQPPARPEATAPAPVLPGAVEGWPRLLPGTELLGQVVGSGLKDAPFLIRRRDAQIVQLSRVLYAMARRMDGRGLGAIAAGASDELGVLIAPELVAHVAEAKLAPLGLTAHRDGRTPRLEARNGLLALRCRLGVLSDRTVNAIAEPLTALFYPPVVILVLAALVAGDAWLAMSNGIAAGLGTVIRSPILFLAIFGVTMLSLAFHEFGHAAACRYGGARPGRIGVGLYMVWPVFFTDVTDSYRLPKRGRLRTDLGGVYFNALWALAAAAAYLVTSYKPFAIVVVTQQLMILDQFMPWIRLDGYHVVSDLIGVSDLFSRIKPVVRSLVPGRRPDPRVLELKRWARWAVTAWVVTTVATLTGVLGIVVLNAPTYLQRIWASMLAQMTTIGHGLETGNGITVFTGLVGTGMLTLSAMAMTFTYLLMCRGAGAALAVRSVRRVAPVDVRPHKSIQSKRRSDACTSVPN